MADHAAEAVLKTPIFSNKTYDAIKWVAQYFLPAFGVLYATLGTLWGWPKVEEVLASTTALALFLGALQGVGARSYKNSDAPYDGDLVVGQTENGNALRFELNHDMETLQGRTEVIFKVKKPDAP